MSILGDCFFRLHLLGAVYQMLASSYWKQRDLEQALEWAQKSLTIAEETGNKDALARSYHQMGLICQSQRDYNQSLEWFHRSIAINKELENRISLAWNPMRLAYVLVVYWM